jgi:simple sugar transport system ATP-binding protein
MTLELREIRKRFGAVRANDGVSLTVNKGELRGLLGENGAGKSTLMKILSGFVAADSGEVALNGTRLSLRSPAEAIKAGIGMLHQDPLVFLPMSVLDNFLLGTPGRALLDRKRAEAELGTLSGRFGFSFDPDAPARTLTVGERQQLEITRLLWLGARVLVLDEPTTGISAIQRVTLFETLRTLAGEGMIVIFVSHKLEEVEELCRRVTVMRQGRVVGEADMPCPTDRLVQMMFGEILVEGERPAADLGEDAVRLDGVELQEQATHVRDLSMTIRAGEVLGLAGLEGSGQRAFLKACAGLLSPAGGRVTVGGRDLTGQHYNRFLAAGVHYLPAGRLEEGLVPGLSIAEHIALTDASTGLFVDWGAARRTSDDRIRDYVIKGTPSSLVDGLSGGNQQRLLLALMPPKLRLLLMEHPTRGLDVESADYVWTRMLARREEGTAIVFASADLDELLRYSDRIAVFFGGDVLRVVDAATTSGEELGYLIGGKERV